MSIVSKCQSIPPPQKSAVIAGRTASGAPTLALMESYRTERGPRQRVVAYRGRLDEAGRLGVNGGEKPWRRAEGKRDSQQALCPEPEPRWAEVDTSAVRVENCRSFGGVWLAWELIRRLSLDTFFHKTIPARREDVPWSVTALILVIVRLCEPSSELHIAEHFYRKTALPDLLGVPIEKGDDNRLYRALDKLLPHKRELEVFLKEKRIEQGLVKIQAGCEKRKYKPLTIARWVGKLLGKNSRAAGLFEVDIKQRDRLER